MQREEWRKKNTVTSESPVDLKGIARCVGQESGIMASAL